MTAKLYEQPILVVDPGMHLASIKRVAAGRDGARAATGADDKTVRVWSLSDGALLRTIRVPAGPDNIGKVYAVAMSPDSSLIAAGGYTGSGRAEREHQIYLFDAASGEMLRRIEGQPDVVNHLAFSRDGRRLAALLFRGGLRLYAAERDWAEAARDEEYEDQCYGADFAPDGRLATTCFDGKVRLYPADVSDRATPFASAAMRGGQRPFGIVFGPEEMLAVGYADTWNVDLLDARTLDSTRRPAADGIDNGDLACVAWSSASNTVYAGGGYADSFNCYPIVARDSGGGGPRRILPARHNTVRSLVALPDGDLLVSAGDPWLARLAPDGTPRWQQGPRSADFRGMGAELSVSFDGTCVGFGFDYGGKSPARFDVSQRQLTLAPEPDPSMAAPRWTAAVVDRWFPRAVIRIGFPRLPLEPYETPRSLAVHPDDQRFVLGTDWTLRGFDLHGAPLWRRPAPGAVWATNVSGDGRLVIAAYGDGTIRWHRMTDGVELLAFMPFADRTNWVVWTPEGFYAASAGAHGVLRWHVNEGWDAPADSVPIAEIPGSYRPELPPLVLQVLETAGALGLAALAEHKMKIRLRTNTVVSIGARLHLLAIGISAYNEDYAKNLRLHYAHRDANELANAIVSTQDGLYQVRPQVLCDKDANKTGILRALKVIRDSISAGGGTDLAVVHFSGHGAMVDGKFFLLPSDVDARDSVGIRASALPIDELKDELLLLARYGRVLVLLDACHSGATTMDGATLPMDSTALRTGLAAANVTVLTSSSGSESSFEQADWQHGAFTKVLLDAFGDPAADLDHNSLISAIGLTKYVTTRVPMLTGGRQNPGIEVRFEGTLFARRV